MVLDLRTDVEVELEGPGPMTAEPRCASSTARCTRTPAETPISTPTRSGRGAGRRGRVARRAARRPRVHELPASPPGLRRRLGARDRARRRRRPGALRGRQGPHRRGGRTRARRGRRGSRHDRRATTSRPGSGSTRSSRASSAPRPTARSSRASDAQSSHRSRERWSASSSSSTSASADRWPGSPRTGWATPTSSGSGAGWRPPGAARAEPGPPPSPAPDAGRLGSIVAPWHATRAPNGSSAGWRRAVAEVVAQSGPGGRETLDAVVVGAGFAGLYMLHRLRGLGLSARVSRRATASAAPGSGTATRARAATSRASTTSTRSTRISLHDWGWTERYPAPAGVAALPQSRRRPLRPAPDIRLNARVSAPPSSTRPPRRWEVRPPTAATASARGSRSWPPAACRRRSRPTSRGSSLRGQIWFHTGRWPASEVDFTGQRVAVDRHRLVRDPADPRRSRSSAASSSCSSARANFSVPAHNRPVDPTGEHDLERIRRAAQGRARVRSAPMVCPGNRKSGARRRPRGARG